MTEEYAAEKKTELLSLLRKGTKLCSVLKDERVVDFVRYRRNVVAMKKIAERISNLPKGK